MDRVLEQRRRPRRSTATSCDPGRCRPWASTDRRGGRPSAGRARCSRRVRSSLPGGSASGSRPARCLPRRRARTSCARSRKIRCERFLAQQRLARLERGAQIEVGRGRCDDRDRLHVGIVDRVRIGAVIEWADPLCALTLRARGRPQRPAGCHRLRRAAQREGVALRSSRNRSARSDCPAIAGIVTAFGKARQEFAKKLQLAVKVMRTVDSGIPLVRGSPLGSVYVRGRRSGVTRRCPRNGRPALAVRDRATRADDVVVACGLRSERQGAGSSARSGHVGAAGPQEPRHSSRTALLAVTPLEVIAMALVPLTLASAVSAGKRLDRDPRHRIARPCRQRVAPCVPHRRPVGARLELAPLAGRQTAPRAAPLSRSVISTPSILTSARGPARLEEMQVGVSCPLDGPSPGKGSARNVGHEGGRASSNHT